MTPSEPKLTHDWEQMAAMMMEFAVALSLYQARLEDGGFTREEAFALVLAYQTSLLVSAKSDRGQT